MHQNATKKDPSGRIVADGSPKAKSCHPAKSGSDPLWVGFSACQIISFVSTSTRSSLGRRVASQSPGSDALRRVYTTRAPPSGKGATALVSETMPVYLVGCHVRPPSLERAY